MNKLNRSDYIRVLNSGVVSSAASVTEAAARAVRPTPFQLKRSFIYFRAVTKHDPGSLLGRGGRTRSTPPFQDLNVCIV